MTNDTQLVYQYEKYWYNSAWIIVEKIQTKSNVLYHFLSYHSIYQYLHLILLCMKHSHSPDCCNENLLKNSPFYIFYTVTISK